jgi:hypothetical protein
MINTIFFVLISIIYFFLSQNIKNQKKYILLFLFISVSLFFRFLIPNERIPDFSTYTDVLYNNVSLPISIVDFYYEPYYLLLSKSLIRWISVPQLLNFYYFSLFSISLIFFSWLSFLNDISPWKKYLLFNLFYILFTFVLLRNGIAYMIFATYFYLLYKCKNVYFQITSFLFHLSSYIVLFFSLFISKKINYYIILVVLVLLASILFLYFNDSSFLYAKFYDYKANGYGYNYKAHNFIFVISLMIFCIVFFFFKDCLNNYFFFLMVILYVIFFCLNPVMGFRFSFYIYLYLLMNPKIRFTDKFEKYSQLLSIPFILLGIITLRLFLFV